MVVRRVRAAGQVNMEGGTGPVTTEGGVVYWATKIRNDKYDSGGANVDLRPRAVYRPRGGVRRCGEIQEKLMKLYGPAHALLLMVLCESGPPRRG